MKNRQEESAWNASRRGFLIKSSVLASGLILTGCGIIRQKAAEKLDGAAATSFDNDDSPTVWFEIASDNTVTFYSPKVEMGQGIHTALAQIAAEELSFDWQKIKVVTASTKHGPNDPRSTGGSDSITSLWDTLRILAAEMREMLVENAATILAVPPDSLSVHNGIISGNGKSITFGEVVQKATKWDIVNKEPILKSKTTYQYIGKSLPRVDIEAKIKGTAVFGIDGSFPDCLYGAIVFPSVLEATFVSADISKAEKMPEVVKVVVEKDFVGVVAKTRYAAEKAKEAIKVTWHIEKRWTQKQLDELVKVGAGKPIVIQAVGDVEDFFGRNSSIITSSYSTPMAVHAQLEPNGAVAYFKDNALTIIMSTQVPKLTQEEVAKALGLKNEAVEIRPMYLGGGFGRRLHTPHAIKVAQLSKAVGKPVHVFFERKEEFQNGYVRPQTNHLLKAVLDEKGTIQAFEHNTSSGDVAFPIVPDLQVPSYASTVLGADFGAWRGGRIFYDFDHKKTISWRTKMPVYSSWWRGLGLLANTFALESFMDELAQKANQDPLDFRLKHLNDSSEASKRMKNVLKAVTDKAGWHSFNKPNRALGLACSTDVGTPVAQVAEVSVEEGQIVVHKITCAVDAGLIINPDGARAQCEGGIMMALSSTLMEGIYLDENGAFSPDMYGSYPILTMKDAPEIEVVLVENGETPKGLGEPPMGPTAAAVANALRKLSGKRVRELPLNKFW